MKTDDDKTNKPKPLWSYDHCDIQWDRPDGADRVVSADLLRLVLT